MTDDLRGKIEGAIASHERKRGDRGTGVPCQCGARFGNATAWREHRAEAAIAVIREHLTSDEAVEAGARAAFDTYHHPDFWGTDREMDQEFRDEARAALTAAIEAGQ